MNDSREKKRLTKEELMDMMPMLITPYMFQDMCKSILESKGYTNAVVQGKGPDGRKDIIAEYRHERLGKGRTEKVYVQCKLYSGSLNESEFSSDFYNAGNDNCDEFIIMSNKPLSKQGREFIDKTNNSHKYSCRISEVTGLSLINLLLSCPSVFEEHFPDYTIPSRFNKDKPSEAINISNNFAKQFNMTFNIKIPKDKALNPNDKKQVISVIKDSLLEEQFLDQNVKSFLYDKIGLLIHDLGDSETAISLLDESIRITPSNISALLNKGYVLGKMNKIKESNKCYDKILRMDSKNKYALNNLSHNLILEGKLDDANKIIDDILIMDNNFVHAISNKAVILKRRGLLDDAINFIKSHTELLAKYEILGFNLIDIYLEQNNLKEAYNLSKLMQSKDLNSLEILNDEGVIYIKNFIYTNDRKYLDLAMSCFDKIIGRNPDYEIAWSNKAVTLLNQGKNDEAKDLIELASHKFPDNPHIMSKRAAILYKTQPKKWNRVERLYNNAIKKRSEYEFILNKAEFYLDLKRWSMAINLAELVLLNDKYNSRAWLIKSIAFKHLREFKNSEDCYKKAKEYERKPILLE